MTHRQIHDLGSKLHLNVPLAIDHRFGDKLIYQSLADATLSSGDEAEARTLYLDSLRHARRINSAPLMLMTLAGLAQLESRLNPDRAAGWLTLILNHPAATQETRQRAEALLAKNKQRVPVNALSLEEAVAEVGQD